MNKVLKSITFILIAGALQASQAYAQPAIAGTVSPEHGVESNAHKSREEVKRDMAESRQNAANTNSLKQLYKGH